MLWWLLTLALTALRCRSYRVATRLGERPPGPLRRGLASSPWHVGAARSGPACPQPSPLKAAEFKGSVVVVDDSNVGRYVEPVPTLLSSRCVGFDLEYVPDYYSSAQRLSSERTRPAVVQIASTDVCLVYLVYKIGHLPDAVSAVLSDPHVLKVSHGAPSDMRLLHRHFGVRSRNFVDLQGVCQELGLRPCSLKSVAEHVLGLRLSKKHQCSNWEAPTLSEAQLQYAATDAWVTLEAFLRLKPRSIRKLLVNSDGDVQVDDARAGDSPPVATPPGAPA